ncbi:NUDIX domain-containing protein [Sphaerisporangium rhizosphaerae]|uniref:NUDIX domain-containing protein n=1 Tax=Sphaerisporangium rhizosphaerae TaxID=2269375 RepID=A0ABW2P652_9ACTN
MDDPDLAFIAGLPRVRAAAGALIRDDAGRVLVVRPTYKPGWDIPGGMIELDESPRAACAREIKEELGIVASLGAMLSVDWVPPRPPWDGGLMFVFDGGVITAAQAADIRLAADELDGFMFAASEQFDDLLPSSLARRVTGSLHRLGAGACYLEDGLPVD